MVVGVHGNLMTGTQPPVLEVIGPDGATVIIHPLPTGVGVAVVVARGRSIVMSVTMATEDVNTAV